MPLMRSPIIRRSSSICASPGPPRVPMPPRWRSRWLQRRTSRVDRYCSRASSTCSLPSWLCARSPKISRISIVRSATATPRWRSRLRCCAGDSAWSKMTASAWCSCDQLLQLVGLARADEEGRHRAPCAGRRRARRRRRRPTRRAARARRATRRTPACAPKSTPTRIARAGASPKRTSLPYVSRICFSAGCTALQKGHSKSENSTIVTRGFQSPFGR